MARPFVPRAGVVARAVTGGAQRQRRDGQARGGVAVLDELRGISDPRADVIARDGLSRRDEQILDMDMTGTRDVTLARIARIAALARVLLGRAHVEDRQRRILET